jgi:hypothetical protein
MLPALSRNINMRLKHTQTTHPSPFSIWENPAKKKTKSKKSKRLTHAYNNKSTNANSTQSRCWVAKYSSGILYRIALHNLA